MRNPETATLDMYALLRSVSRTFALSIEQLPALLRETVTIAYLLFRVADCIEDHPDLSREQKARLLRLWADILSGNAAVEVLIHDLKNLDASDPEVAVALRADAILTHMHALHVEPSRILRQHVKETALGMARWQDRGPYVNNEAEMDDYMHEVAGRVGYLLTDIFSWYAPSIRALRDFLMPRAREFGLALQTVNIIRGMRKDFERGWVFVPESFCAREGLSRENLFDPAYKARALNVVAALAEKALRHLHSGLSYIMLLPRLERRIRLFCIWPLMFAAKTLAISRNNPAVLSAEAKITRQQVKAIVFYSRLFSWSNFFLRAYFNSLLKLERA